MLIETLAAEALQSRQSRLCSANAESEKARKPESQKARKPESQKADGAKALKSHGF